MKAITGRAGRAPSSLVIDEAYLRRFGELLVPVDAWIETAIVAEWVRLMNGYALRQDRKLSEAKVAQAIQQQPHTQPDARADHSTVTDFARFLGLSTSVPRSTAV